MSKALALTEEVSDELLLKLAREVALEIQPIETILNAHRVSPETWDKLSSLPRFQRYLAEAVEAWGSSLNTHERVKLKAATLVEEWLPELNARLHDPQETLPAKTEAAKLAARLAGMGLTNAGVDVGGEKFSVTINLGDAGGGTLKYEKVTPKVIDVTPDEGS